MARHWVVKKDHRWVWVFVYSAVGIAVLMCIMTFAAMSAAK